MENTIFATAGDAIMLIGAFFIFLGAFGLVRMPDIFTRAQAGTKAVTLGSIALLAGLLFHHPEWWPKLVLIMLFILLTSPIAGSTLVRAARAAGHRPWRKGEADADADAEGRRS